MRDVSNMARSETDAGVPAYSSEAQFTGGEVWKSYAGKIGSRAKEVISPILARKGQSYGVNE
jgi:hypothetical protein